jgi:transposase-like protein
MSAPDPHEEPPIILTPRSVAADVFEQNPLSTAHERNGPAGLTAAEMESIPEEERVREAVRRVIQDGRPIHEVARELHLSATSIRAWKSKYSSFLQEHAFGESNPAVAAEDSNLSRAQQARFMDNWQELLVETHASEADFKQDPLLVFLQTNGATSWLYDDEGKLERFSLFGILLIFLGIASVLIFLTVDKGGIAPVQDFRVTDSLVPEPSLRYDLDIDRAGKIVQKFLQADGYISKLNFLREREQVTPIVREFYQTHSDKPVFEAVQSYGMVGHGLVSIAFEVPDQGSLFFNLVPDGKSYLIDWFTSTLYQTDHIEKLIANKSTTPTLLHVQVERDSYFNYEFTKDQYECFKIKFPGLLRDLVGYARKESPEATELMLLTALEPTHAAVIEVRYPANPKDLRQLEIVKFVNKDWLPF